MRKLILITILALCALIGRTQTFDYQVKGWQLQTDTSYVEGDIPETIGTLFWDKGNHTISVILENGVKGQMFQEIHIYGKNTSGVAISNGMAVSLTTNPAQFATFEKTDITSISSARAFVGLATEDIGINEFGYVTISGNVRDIPTLTTGLTEKNPVYVSTTPGLLTSTMPNAPNICILVGNCERAHATQGRINVNSSIMPRLQDLSDVNGTPLTTKGQIPVWDEANNYFDFDYNIWPDLISNEGYGSSWDGVDSVAPSKNAVYDKLKTMEAVNYCPATMTVNRGTLVTGTAADLCDVGGTDVQITELTGTDPLRVTFAFSGVEKISAFVFYGDYNGGSGHVVWAEIYNYNTSSWDYLGQFLTSPTKAWYTFPIYNSLAYISSGAVQVRLNHQGTGVNTYNLYLDYLDVNFGGGSGGGGGSVGVIPSTAYANKVAMTANPLNVTWPTDFSNNNYFLSINAYYEKTINSKVVRIKNAVYDFTKTVSGFSLKVDTLAGYVEYFAADTIMTTAFDNFLAKSDSLTQYVTPTQLKDSMNTVVVTETDPTVAAYTKGLTTDNTVLTAVKNVDGTGSGLDADLLDGQHGSYYQPTSTAINTGNIESQSVSYATSAGSVTNSQVIKFNTGTTEGTDLYTYNGSAAKTVDIKPGTNVTFTAAAGSVTINSTGGSSTFSGCVARNDNSQSLSTVYSSITFALEDLDTDSYHSTSTNTGRLTVPSTGNYEITFSSTISFSTTTVNLVTIALTKNGTDIKTVYYQQDENFIVNNLTAFLPCYIVAATASDYFEVKIKVSANSAATLIATSSDIQATFQIKKL